MFNKLRKVLELKAEKTIATLVVRDIEIKIKVNMKNNSSWKSTLIGAAGAVFIACLPIIQNGAFDMKRDWSYLVGAAGTAAFGYIAKDSDKTGLPEEPSSEQRKTGI